MAISGSFSTDQVQPDTRVWYWDFSWWVTGWSGNTASVHWEVITRCTSGTSGSTHIANYGFGGHIYEDDITNPGGNFIKDEIFTSGDTTIPGGTTFSASVVAHPFSSGNMSSEEKSWTLDNNATKPTVTVTISSRTETTITASMSVTDNGHQTIQKKSIELFSDSACLNRVGIINNASGTFTGLTPNKTYYARSNANNGYFTGYSKVASNSTYQYPYISAINKSDFVIGNQQTVTIYNPLGRSVNIYMKKNNINGTTLFSRTGATTGTSYSFTPSTSTLYSSIPDTISGDCVYYCTYSNNNVSVKNGTYRVSGNNAQAPNFTNFNYKDKYWLSSALTGKTGVNNPGILIAGLSDCEFTVTTSQKATSSYGATLNHYNFSWPNGVSTSSSYSSSQSVINNVNNGNTNKISVTAYDKRGQYKTVSKNITLITPTHATGNLNTVRRNGIDSVVYLNGSISYWTGDWANGSSRPNNLYDVEYRINKTGSYYQIKNAVVSNSTSATSNKIKTLTLKSNMIQLHANGSSGGFTVGTSYTVEIFITTGVVVDGVYYYYDERQKVAEILITSGIFGMSRYKGNDGRYHYGFNGLPVNDKTVKVNGTLESTGSTYVGADGLYIRTALKQFGILRKENKIMAKLHLAQQLIDILWPVGSVYISTDAVNPSTKFGGTWTQITGGFIYGTTSSTGTKGNTGNTGTGTSTGKNNGDTGSTILTIDQIPSHDHSWSSPFYKFKELNMGYHGDVYKGDLHQNSTMKTEKTGGGKGHTHTLNNHQHTIPYIECYVWKRTA